MINVENFVDLVASYGVGFSRGRPCVFTDVLDFLKGSRSSFIELKYPWREYATYLRIPVTILSDIEPLINTKPRYSNN